ncbi:alpha/beta fold hydrolase [Actinocorallia lasiicapitis]
MSEFLEVAGGRIAYEVVGEGPLVVLSHGIGDRREVFRFLAPLIAAAGYRVAVADLRGHGESSLGWAGISRTDVAGDLLALVRELGGPAVIVGHSLSGGAATIAAASAPQDVCGIVELNPFTLTQAVDFKGLFGVARYRKGMSRLMRTMIFKSLGQWRKYLDVAYATKPADYDRYMAELAAKLREPGRFAEFLKTGKSTPADAHARLADVRCPALIVMGLDDPDFADPRREGEKIVAALPDGLGSLAVVEHGGHYIHAEQPERVAELILPFLREHARG